MYTQNFTVRLKFSVRDNANCRTIAVIASMTIVELFDEFPPPPPFPRGVFVFLFTKKINNTKKKKN